MKELIDFLEKKGFTLQANNLKNGTTELNFRYDHIGDAGAIGLADALNTNTVLTELNFRYNQIGDEGAIGLADALKTNSSITSLNLWGNEIGDEGAIGLAEALKTNSSITSLSFEINQIGAAGTRVFADALKTNSFITSLNLKINQIEVVEDKEIKEKINYNKVLFQKLTSLLYNFYTHTEDYTLNNPYALKVLTANKFYQAVNKQLLKESLQEQGIKDVESMLKKVDDLIKMQLFTIAGVCKNIQPATELATLPDIRNKYVEHISELSPELITNITSYLGNEPWELNALGSDSLMIKE